MEKQLQKREIVLTIEVTRTLDLQTGVFVETNDPTTIKKDSFTELQRAQLDAFAAQAKADVLSGKYDTSTEWEMQSSHGVMGIAKTEEELSRNTQCDCPRCRAAAFSEAAANGDRKAMGKIAAAGLGYSSVEEAFEVFKKNPSEFILRSLEKSSRN